MMKRRYNLEGQIVSDTLKRLRRIPFSVSFTMSKKQRRALGKGGMLLVNIGTWWSPKQVLMVRSGNDLLIARRTGNHIVTVPEDFFPA